MGDNSGGMYESTRDILLLARFISAYCVVYIVVCSLFGSISGTCTFKSYRLSIKEQNYHNRFLGLRKDLGIH